LLRHLTPNEDTIRKNGKLLEVEAIVTGHWIDLEKNKPNDSTLHRTDTGAEMAISNPL